MNKANPGFKIRVSDKEKANNPDIFCSSLNERKYRWKLPDAYQAAIAVEHKMVRVTRSTKRFRSPNPRLP